MTRLLVMMLVAALTLPASAVAQVPADVWRTFAEKVEVGTEIRVRLEDGKRFRAVMVNAGPDALLLQPKTRVAVPVQSVPYDTIVAIERVQDGGMGAAKAAAIGVASGVGAFFAIMGIMIAVVAD